MNDVSAHRSSLIAHRSRLLVLRLSALGDVIHTLPAVLAMREQAEITWVVEAPYAELVEIVAGVKTIPVRMKKWKLDPRAATDAIGRMRTVDASIDFQGLIKSAILGWLSGARTRYGFNREAVREKPSLLFTNKHVNVDTTKHVVDQNLELAQATKLYGQRATGNWQRFPSEVPGYENAIVLLPGAGKPNKIWPHFLELAKTIGPKALVVWGPGERELAEAIGGGVAPPTNLRELAWILQNAEAVIGGDTGPLHLADALGTKVVGLYGPTDPRRNGPYGQPDHVIDRFRTTKSMESISVEEVMKTLERVLGE
ncbi:MAG TPA: glycosyltransferase family 9 protein [Thermoanaerobaculia bacterium]|jgi:heptosyltransferase-1|nr:glycosyltransferase family 9 protein [Thermoanaerobaculia bacterium]